MNPWIFVIFKLTEIASSLLASAKKPNIKKKKNHNKITKKPPTQNLKLVMTKDKNTLFINFQE